MLCPLPCTRILNQNQRNVHQFLLAQMGTIATLSIGDWMGLYSLKLIFHMSFLMDVTIQGVQDFINVNQQKIGTILMSIAKPSLKLLNFHDMSNSRKILKVRLTVVPRLMTLEILSMNQLIMGALHSSFSGTE